MNNKIETRKIRIKQSRSYSTILAISNIMDRYFLDPIIGLFLPGWGDTLSSVLGLPYLYISIFKVRSLPLTLAVIFNILADSLVSSIPLLGDIFDFFYRSYKKNLILITGYVEEDRQIISEVNRKAVWMGIGIIILLSLLYFIMQLVSYIVSWIISLF